MLLKFPSDPSHHVAHGPSSATSCSHESSSSPGYTGDSMGRNDIVIAVMGPTGAGKSTFINAVTGGTEATIGYSLKSQTRVVQPVRCQHPDGRDIVLVDTPGFDDTHLSDTKILRIVADWLKETYQNDIKLTGLLYLHAISDNKMAGTALRNLAVFKDLCGDDNLKNVVLVTTKWDRIENESIGSDREEELKSTFWKEMICLGSRTYRFQRTQGSGWGVIDGLLSHGSLERPEPLQIQHEMVDRGLALQETAAGKSMLRSLAGEFMKVWARLHNGAHRITGSRKLLNKRSWGWPFRIPNPPSSNSTSNHTNQHSPALTRCTSSSWSTSSRGSLSAVIVGLGITYDMADIVSIPTLQESITTVRQVAEHLESMGGTHTRICQVLEQSGQMLHEIARRGSKVPEDAGNVLDPFQKHIRRLLNVTASSSNRGSIDPLILNDADNVITACTDSIKEICNKFDIELTRRED